MVRVSKRAAGVDMSPVPSFDGRGLLPPVIGADETTRDRSPYFASMTELVATLGTTPWRENLLFGLLEYRKLLGHHGYTDGLQFIDGSFVENVEVGENRDPGDIDVFSFLMRPAAYQQDPNRDCRLSRLDGRTDGPGQKQGPFLAGYLWACGRSTRSLNTNQ